jgi:cytochrome oxidase assembly protein ShyY1
VNERSPRASGGLLWPSLAALLAFIVLLGLGIWQLDRKAWKEGLIAALDERLAAEPGALPPPERWAMLDSAADEFRRVTFSATLTPGEEALVYAAGSAFRPDVSGPGYWVFAPARLANGATVLVNRGFVQEGQQHDASAHAPRAGSIAMVGALRWAEPRGWFAPNDTPARNLFFVRDPVAIAAAKGWGKVAPFYVELETPTGEGNLPRAGRLVPALRNDHLQYALTWFGLAAVLAIAFASWVRSRRREAE